MKLSGDLNALTQGALSCIEVSIHFLESWRDGAHRSRAIEQVRAQCCTCTALPEISNQGRQNSSEDGDGSWLGELPCRVQSLSVALHLLTGEPCLSARKCRL